MTPCFADARAAKVLDIGFRCSIPVGLCEVGWIGTHIVPVLQIGRQPQSAAQLLSPSVQWKGPMICPYIVIFCDGPPAAKVKTGLVLGFSGEEV
jgi:hypothetical protein